MEDEWAAVDAFVDRGMNERACVMAIYNFPPLVRAGCDIQREQREVRCRDCLGRASAGLRNVLMGGRESYRRSWKTRWIASTIAPREVEPRFMAGVLQPQPAKLYVESTLDRLQHSFVPSHNRLRIGLHALPYVYMNTHCPHTSP
jgi:hypothetical protein